MLTSSILQTGGTPTLTWYCPFSSDTSIVMPGPSKRSKDSCSRFAAGAGAALVVVAAATTERSTRRCPRAGCGAMLPHATLRGGEAEHLLRTEGRQSLERAPLAHALLVSTEQCVG